MGDESEEPDFNHMMDKDEIPSVEHLSALDNITNQIKSIPTLISTAKIIDQATLQNFEAIQEMASEAVIQMAVQSKKMISRFDKIFVPIVEEALNELIRDAQALKSDLDETLRTVDSTMNKNWSEHAKKWSQIYSRWYDRKILTQKVLTKANERASHLIEKDIKVIKNYLGQTLSSLSKGSEEFIQLERRLYKATAEPLRHLVNLKKLPEKNLSIIQASEWISNLQHERENFFNQVLAKIDASVKEIVSNEINDDEKAQEIIEELAFIDQEMLQISEQLNSIPILDFNDVHFFKERLQSLVEHLKEFNLSTLPKSLRDRMNLIHFSAISILNQIKPFEK